MKDVQYFDKIILNKELSRDIRKMGQGDALTQESAKKYFESKRPFLYLRIKTINEYNTFSFQVDLVNPVNSEVLFSAKSSGRESIAGIMNEFILYISEHSNSFQAKSALDS